MLLPVMMPQPCCPATRAVGELRLETDIEIGGPDFWNGFGMVPIPSSGMMPSFNCTFQNSPLMSYGGSCAQMRWIMAIDSMVLRARTPRSELPNSSKSDSSPPGPMPSMKRPRLM